MCVEVVVSGELALPRAAARWPVATRRTVSLLHPPPSAR